MTSHPADPAKALDSLRVGDSSYQYYRLDAAGAPDLEHLPYTVKVLLENMLRGAATTPDLVSGDDVRALANWDPTQPAEAELPFMPARVILQDFTGVPCVVDLAAMRDAIAGMGGDPSKINPLVPADLVIDHSVQVDQFGSDAAFLINVDREYERNGERYALLRWAQQAFADFRVVPPGTGIVHQVNLEYLADVVAERDGVLMPDTLVGTDSHTTMINGLGVVGWGVGGIEAEGVMLGQPIYMLPPEVVGMKLTGALPPGATATDLVLTVTQLLRKQGVVNKFVEFFGDGVSTMSLADRATIGNMAPEYGATMGFFPIDDETLRYLSRTGRTAAEVQLVERYTKEQGLFRTNGTPPPLFTSVVELDLSSVEPSLAGPKRPQDRIPLAAMKQAWRRDLAEV
ncbi:MAG TPA: aconitase family protein, partial [Candidatus Limnocylindrales bacterium]|nr:aconitase family protein [Candidatus Limnocylindrales bacterium]